LARVDNNGFPNRAKAGRAIPLRWRLTDTNGSPITNLPRVSVVAVGLSCSSGMTTDQIKEYAAGGSGFQNLGSGCYQ